jgi:prepilin-type N-terminal cleavage/methylation domain-containing protein
MLKIRTNGLTLLEVLVAITIIAILAAGLYTVSSRVEKQAKEKLTKSTIEILCTALEQYRDFYGKFPFIATTAGYNKACLEGHLEGSVTNKTGGVLSDYNDIYASSEALYHFLNKCPSSKKIIGSINPSLLTNKDNKNTEYFFKFSSDPGNYYPLVHIIDAWNVPFRYTYTLGNNFPVIISAGPDKNLNTSDDISSR